ncbi:possible tyrosine transporter P-protein [Saccharicrinis carchari]|uniref:Possible tyrosine transporter P-protein n=1 Tax=Saccharicrinis carchari TaxID=1168039 RepID=A0A521DZ37_SACCC|nr:ArsB/NhaD family transporter [Saccharicrinis carchari]SMO76984.1 possible tyrosine transporter P-protein [Saccharicrinis carchari]
MLLLVSSQISTFHIIIALVVFTLTFTLITTEKLPNAIAAMLGGFLFVAFHIISQNEAVEYIDFDTIGLLCGMMMTVAIMRKTGLFEYIAIKGIKITGGNPWRILVVLSIVTAVLSAFLDNVTTVLIIVPLTFAVADTIKISPLPLLISEILFSNIGGAATLIGDPPNIMIGGATHLDFMDFIINNLPIVIIVSIVTFGLLSIIYKKKLNAIEVDTSKVDAFDEKRAIKDKKFLIKNLIVFALIIGAFMTHHIHHVSLASVALGGGFLLMMITKEDPEEILKEVEWPTLFFFIGLFVIVGGLEKTGVITYLADQMIVATGGEAVKASQLILWMSAICTTFINSIPYTATMISVIENMGEAAGGNIDSLWWALSLGACFGGNGTLIGAAANIIVAGFTQKTDHPLRFKEYLKIGIPLMLVSIALASLYIHFRYFLL